MPLSPPWWAPDCASIAQVNDKMNTNALMNRLGGKLSLPSLPKVVLEVQEVVRTPGCGIQEVGKKIAQDPPLAARILRIANSAYYSLRTPVMEICHAAAILGLDTLQTVVLQVSVAELFARKGAGGVFKPTDLWKHSVLTAQLSGSFPASALRGTTKEEVYVAGLLHDIGKFVMFENMHDDFADAVLLSIAQGRALWRVEQEVFGFTHAEVGELVANRWGLPKKAIAAIGHHHDQKLQESSFSLVPLVALANHIANHTVTNKRQELDVPVPDEWLECLGLEESDVERLVERSFEFQEES